MTKTNEVIRNRQQLELALRINDMTAKQFRNELARIQRLIDMTLSERARIVEELNNMKNI